MIKLNCRAKCVTIAFLLAATTINAQNFQWAKAFGGNSYDGGTSIAVDPWGNVVTAGYFSGTVDFDPGPDTSYLTAKGGSDIFVQKMDASGNFLWAKAFGGTYYGICLSISVDSLGNIYTTGRFAGTIDFDPAGAGMNITAKGEADMFVHKLNGSGMFQWVKTLGGYFNTIAYVTGTSISVDVLGNIYTTGYFFGTIDFDPGPGTTDFTATVPFDIFVHKMNSSGTFQWVKVLGGLSDNKGYSIKVDASGNVYTTGSFEGIVDFDPGPETSYLRSSGGSDIFVQKMNASGKFLWAKAFGGAKNDSGISLTVDASGNVYTTGHFRWIVDFDPGAGRAILTAKDMSDIFVQKMDASGNFLWAKAFSGDKNSSGTSIKVDASGNVYTTGHFVREVDFDPGAGTAILSYNGPSGSGIFVQKMDASGNFIWAKAFGSTKSFGGGEPNSIIDASGNIYTIGSFEGVSDFDPGAAGTAILTSKGETDIFVQKMSQVTTGVVELDNGIEILTYPNPNNGLVQVSFQQAIKDAKIILTDIQGKVVYSNHFDIISNEQLYINGSSGIYFLSVITPNGQSVVKLIKE